MWNFAALDRSPTINRRSYFQTGVTPKASSNARKILILSSIHPRTSSHLRKHRTSVPPTPHSPSCRNYTLPPTAPHTLPPCPRFAPNHTHSHTHSHTPDAPPSHTPPTATPHPRHTPDAPFLRTHTPSQPTATPHPKVARNSSRTPFPDSSKTTEYQRSDFKL